MPPDPSENQDAPSATEEFLRLLGSHERRLLALVVAMTSDWSAAEDILQEVRIRLWKEFPRFDPARDFGAWARTIARFEVLNYRKKHQNLPWTFSEEFLDAMAEQAERTPDDQGERLRALGHCLEQISDANRGILMRYYRGSESLREIAEKLGRSYAGTRQLVVRTREVLAACVERTLNRMDRS
jgi:RNA polymerase sigma-70 factor (ECF subfamily)